MSASSNTDDIPSFVSGESWAPSPDDWADGQAEITLELVNPEGIVTVEMISFSVLGNVVYTIKLSSVKNELSAIPMPILNVSKYIIYII